MGLGLLPQHLLEALSRVPEHDLRVLEGQWVKRPVDLGMGVLEPVPHLPILRSLGPGQDFLQILEATDASAIFRRRCVLSGQAAGIGLPIGVNDCFPMDGVAPVITKIVDVGNSELIMRCQYG